MNSSSFRKIRRLQRRMLDAVVRRSAKTRLEARAEYFSGLFEKHLKPYSRILDVGGGWGFYDAPLRRRGHSPVVLDVVKPGLQMAPVVIYSGEGKIPFPDQSFDAALLVTMLHHVYDPAELIREVKRVTRGALIVVEDLYRSRLGRLWTEWRDRVYNFEFFGHPCQFRSRNEWLTYFEGHGLKPVAVEETYTWLCGMRILNGIFVFKPSV